MKEEIRLSSVCLFATDSPGVSASAGPVELFRGFSFEAPRHMDEDIKRDPRTPGVDGVGGGGGATAGSHLILQRLLLVCSPHLIQDVIILLITHDDEDDRRRMRRAVRLCKGMKKTNRKTWKIK